MPCSSLCVRAAHGGGPPLLARALGIWSTSLQRSAQARALDFSSRPYFRVLLGCIQELTPRPGHEEQGVACLAVIAQALLDVQPLRVPSFTFAWLELVSHRQDVRAAHALHTAAYPRKHL